MDTVLSRVNGIQARWQSLTILFITKFYKNPNNILSRLCNTLHLGSDFYRQSRPHSSQWHRRAFAACDTTGANKDKHHFIIVVVVVPASRLRRVAAICTQRCFLWTALPFNHSASPVVEHGYQVRRSSVASAATSGYNCFPTLVLSSRRRPSPQGEHSEREHEFACAIMTVTQRKPQHLPDEIQSACMIDYGHIYPLYGFCGSFSVE